MDGQVMPALRLTQHANTRQLLSTDWCRDRMCRRLAGWRRPTTPWTELLLRYTDDRQLKYFTIVIDSCTSIYLLTWHLGM